VPGPNLAGDQGTLVLANGTFLPGNTSVVSDFTLGASAWVPTVGELLLADESTAGWALLVYNGSNDTLVGRILLPSTGGPADGLAYDPSNHQLYVTTEYGPVEVVSLASDSVIGSIPVGPSPTDIIWNPRSGDLVETDWNLGEATILSPATDRAIGNVSLGLNPRTLAYDPWADRILVTGSADFVDVLNASTAQLVGNLSVGNPSYGILADPSTENLYVAVGGLANISVINGSSVAVVGSFAVDVGPGGLALDARHGILYVSCPPSGVLDALNLSTGRVDRAVASPLALAGVGFNPARNEAFLLASSQVLLIDGRSLNVSRTLVLGTTVDATTVDAAAHRLYAADSANDWVWVVDTSNESIVGHVSVGAYPTALALNPADHQLYVANIDGTTISVIDTTTDRLAAAWPTAEVTGWLAYDALDGKLFASSFDYYVEVFNVTTGRQIDDIVVNQKSSGLTYDAATGHVYVAVSWYGASAIDAINASSDHVDADILLGAVSGSTYDVAVSGNSGDLYVSDFADHQVEVVNPWNGSTFADILAPNVTGGSLGGLAFDPWSGDVLLANGYNVTEINDTDQRAVGYVPTSVSSADVSVDPSTGEAYVAIADGGVARLRSSVAPGPIALGLRVSPAPSDLGASVDLNAVSSGGTPPFHVAWTGLPAGCQALPLRQFACIPNATGTYNLSVQLTDANGNSSFESAMLSVRPDPRTSFSVIPNPVADGTPVAFSASTYGGTPPLRWTWEFGDGSNATGPNVSHSYSAPGGFDGTLVVADAGGYSHGFNFVLVVRGPLALRGCPSRIPADVGLPVTFLACFDGGTPPFVVRWGFGDGTGITARNTTHAYQSAGSYLATMSVTDAVGVTIEQSIGVQVNATPRVVVNRTGIATEVGFPVALRANVSGGTPPYQVEWDLGDGTLASGPSLTHVYAIPGTFTVRASFTDALGVANATDATVAVEPRPTVIPAWPALTAVSGAVVGLPSWAVGGIPPYHVEWEFEDGSSAVGANVTHRFTSLGVQRVSIALVDAFGATANGSVIVTVTSPEGPAAPGPRLPGFLGTGPGTAALVAVGLGAAALAAFAIARRNHRHRPGAADQHGQPPAPEPPGDRTHQERSGRAPPRQ
jgi:YVTN family beta-propeller protein